MARVSGAEAAAESAAPPAVCGLQMATPAVLHANRRAAHLPFTRRDRWATLRLEFWVLGTIVVTFYLKFGPSIEIQYCFSNLSRNISKKRAEHSAALVCLQRLAPHFCKPKVFKA